MIKTRFAPSPTGYLHVGGLRTALYCYLFAKANKGKFVLRIEDTDQERYVEGATENLLETLDWCGLSWDEGPTLDEKEKGNFGPYIQSKRTDIYKEHIEKLLKSGHAYYCFCTKDKLEQLRNRQKENKQNTMYDRKCCDLPESEIKAKLKKGLPYVIRQKIPYEIIKFKDLVRGNVQFDGKNIDDQVLIKSDGYPTYHLANVVDDHLMEITHVIRGEEWLPSTPKHIALYKAFGWDVPEFAHLPLLLNADRSKLSKRQGHVSVEEYIKKNYSHEAIINFVAFLGWNPGSGEENEIFSLKELEKKFSLEKVHKSGAIFNIEKLNWFNWQWRIEDFEYNVYIKPTKKIDPKCKIGENVYDDIGDENRNHFLFETTNSNKLMRVRFSSTEKGTEWSGNYDEKNEKAKYLYKLAEKHIPAEFKVNLPFLYKTLLVTGEKILKDPTQTADNIYFYFKLPSYNKELLTHEKMKVDLEMAKKALTASLKDLENLDDWTEESLKQTLLKTVEKLGVKNGQVFWPLRAALTGLKFSPGVFESAWVLEKDETLSRIKETLSKL